MDSLTTPRYTSINIEDYDSTVLTPHSKKVYRQWSKDKTNELLIDGYIRQKCHIEREYLFPTDIKKIIADYYSKHTTREALKKRIQSAQRQIQNARWEREDNHCRYFSTYCVNLIYLVLAIVCIVFGFKSTENNCSAKHYSIVTPNEFLIIAGIAMLVHIAINMTIPIIELQRFCCIEYLKKTNVGYCDEDHIIYAYLLTMCCGIIFYMIWFCCGFYIYVNEMDEACQNTAVGKLMLAWNIIMVVPIGCICCSFIGCLCIELYDICR